MGLWRNLRVEDVFFFEEEKDSRERPSWRREQKEVCRSGVTESRLFEETKRRMFRSREAALVVVTKGRCSSALED